ncbi:hypothetical protein VaNZ11_008517 [Volvox africanus]|uniref:Importin N-terminal domain-containing protein n=1 Tax=Volvox africanus TaxID=51714 RepID=A0ABQ5S5X0_9CHLO|nr:hypothetical protein VaNZ11_008517 [Volvox africanus]
MNEQFRAAVAAVYGHDPARRQAANIWLDAFSRTPEAWGCALSLLEHTSNASVEQRFFAANLLASKTRSDWAGLDPQQRSQLAEAFGTTLRNMLLPPGALSPSAAVSLEPVLLERVARLAAAAAALGGLATAERHLTLAQELATAAQPMLGSAAAPEANRSAGEALLRCALLVLQQLAEEAEALDSVRRKALLAGPDGLGGAGGLAAQRPGVVALTRDVVASAAGWGTSVGSPGVSFPLLLSAVRCLSAWVWLDESGYADGGLSSGALQAMSPGLLPSALSLLALPPSGPPTPSPLATSQAALREQQHATSLYAAVSELAAELLGSGSRTAAAAAGGEAAEVAAAAAAVDVLISIGRPLATAAAAERAAEAAAAGGGSGNGGEVGAALAALLAWSRVAVAVAERNAGGLTSGPGERAVQLADCVVGAWSACPDCREVAEVCADYFLAVNTVPTAERNPALTAPLYSALLPHVLRAVSYPAGFQDWETEVEEDEEAFHWFREQQAADLLETIWGQCRTAMVSQLVAEATSTGPGGAAAAATTAHGGGGGARGPHVSDWRRVEAALFCLRAVNVPVKAAAMGGRAGALDNAQAAATSAELQALLGRLFGDICSPSGRVAGLLVVPWVCLAVSRLIGEYAAWLGKTQDAPLQAAMGLLIHALSVPTAAPAAAQAFRNCCVRGADKLTSDLRVLTALATAAMAVVAPPPPPGGGAGAAVLLGLEERSAVAEGLSRLASGLPAEAAVDAACGLIAPCVSRAQSVAAAAAAAGGPLSTATLAALAAELGLMTAVVRFLEPPPGPHRIPPTSSSSSPSLRPGAAAAAEDHPALRALQVAWPVLSAVAGEPQCQTDPGVVEALAELYKCSLMSTKLAGRPLLPPLIGAMLGVLRVRPHAAVLECLAAVVELFGEVAHSGETRNAQIAALDGCIQMMGALMANLSAQQQASSGAPAATATSPFPSDCSASELAAAFFSLTDRYLVFARDLLMTGQGAAALPALLEWVCDVIVSMREREPVAAALSFLSHLLSAAARLAAEETSGGVGGSGGDGATAAETRARLDALFGRCGPRLVHSLLVCGTDTCPPQLMRPLAGCLMGLITLADAGTVAAPPPGVVSEPPPISPGDSELRRGLLGWLLGSWQLPPLAGLIQRGWLGTGGEHALLFTSLMLRGHYLQADIARAFATAPGAVAPTIAAANMRQLPRGRLDALVTDFFRLTRGEADADVLLAYEL